MQTTKVKTTWETIEEQWSLFLEEYELEDGNGGSYKPSEAEQAMMIDAFAGFVNKLDRDLRVSP